MDFIGRKAKYLYLSFLKYDLKASITVFFVALPLCLGISLASNAPVYSGIIAGIIGGVLITLISRSPLSVSGPAAGLTAICATAITDLGAIEIFFLSVSVAGVIQVILGGFKLGGFTHFIPSAVIKGMLTAIGIILISKQIPALIGYNQPEFWSNELFNIITFDHVFKNVHNLYLHTSAGSIIVASLTLIFLIIWKKTLSKKITFLPASFMTVIFGILMAWILKNYFPSFQLKPSQYVTIPADLLTHIKFPDFSALFTNALVWKTAIIIAFVASLETLLSIEAIDKLDPYNRVTPQNRELVAQGTGNFVSGLLGGLPVTAVIVRSSANAEAGAKTSLASITHGIWLFLAVMFAIPLLNLIPFSVLAVILVRTGYNLAKPKMIKAVYKQGREQFLPFIVTIIAVLFTDLLIGVLIGIGYALYFLIKHTYRAGYTVRETDHNGFKHFTIDLALNVSFLNKKRFMEMLDQIPAGSEVEIIGTDSVYIDYDILEIFHDFKSKAQQKNIKLKIKDIPDVETIELH